MISRDFRRLWAAVSISHFGTMLGALPLTALVYLDATPMEMGVLVAATTAPPLVVGLFGGVWVDRSSHRLVLVIADFGRFAVLLTVPAAALLGSLGMEQLYVVAFAQGCLEVLFILASRSAVPALVRQDRLVQANARLRMSESIAETVSPTAGGGLVQAFSAPFAVLIDALSFLASGLLVARLQLQARRATKHRAALREAIEGFRTCLEEPSLRALMGMSCTYGFFEAFILTLFALRVLNELDLSPLALGLLAAGGGVGSFLGAVASPLAARRLGVGPAIVASYLLAVLADLSIPLAQGPPLLAFTILFTGQLAGNVFYVVENVTSLSLRQSITKPESLGRVNATFLVANRSLRPLGALLCGVIAELIGVRETIFVGWVGTIAAWAWLVFSPLPRLKSLPQLAQ